MAVSWVFLALALAALMHSIVETTAQINDPEEYSATVVPRDPGAARQLLGYNKYDGHAVQNSDKTVLYGNNWEQFDGNSAPQKLNQYSANGNGYNNPRRYYRSVVN